MKTDGYAATDTITDIIACVCPECGLRQRRVGLAVGQVANCRRCGAELYHRREDSEGRSLALALTAAILWLPANLFPILGVNVQGQYREATLFDAVVRLREQGMDALAGLVMFTTLVVPALEIFGLLYVLAPLRLGFRLPCQAAAFRLIRLSKPWGMVEVFMLGVLVALTKMTDVADVSLGWALWLYGALVLLLAAIAAVLDEQRIGERLGLAGTAPPAREPGSLDRCWALLLAAAILYIPANALPVMYSRSLLESREDTILSGVVYLWTSGSWPLALVVFVASIMVPLLKIIAMTLLLVTAQRRSRWRPLDRARLYRLTEVIGRWSMVDIFVVTLSVALMNVKPFSAVDAGPGAVAFGAVVVLTLLATLMFDPHLIWEPFTQDQDARR
jgi:paraquat-inducible protein A